MKLVNTVRLTGAMLAGVLLSLFSATSFAANTAASTSITNLATVNYSVGGVSQTPIGSSSTGNTSGAGTPTSFLVDDKLLLTVTTVDTADVAVTPGQTGAVLVYKVTNNGNATQGVILSTIQEANGVANPFTGGVDDFDPTAITVHVSQNNTATYVPANDTATGISQLAAGASAFVFIVSNIPSSQVDADVAVEALAGQVAATGTAGYANPPGAAVADQSGSAWTPGTVQNIFADAAGTDDIALDGKSSSRDAYLVKSAKLTITKTASVVSDPTGDATPHAIPGAVMQYTITVVNSGTTAASSITLADSIQAMVTASDLAYKANSITIKDPNVSAGATQACTDAGSTFGADTCSFTSGTNTVNALINTLTNGQTATVTFQVTIQ
jgi:hypothetical protein